MWDDERALMDFVHSPNRLRYPQYRAPGGKEWQRLSWEEAFTRIARLMKASTVQRYQRGGCGRAAAEVLVMVAPRL